MKSVRRVVLFVLIIAAAFTAAADDIGPNEALRLRQAGEILALEKLLDIALSLHPGARLLEAELEQDDGRYVYEVELITRSGAVRDIEIDARDGRILKDEDDD